MGILLRWAHRFRRRLAVISALSIVSSAAMLALPWLAGQFVGGVLGEGGIDVDRVLLLLVLTLAALALVTAAVTIVSEDASGRILADLRAEIYSHVQSLPPSFHDQARDGDLLSLMTYEVTNLSNFLAATLAQVPAMIVTAAGATVLLLVLDPVLALVIPVLVPVFFVVLKLVGRRQRALAERGREAQVEVITRAAGDLDMTEAIKSFAVEEHHRAGYRAAVERARRLSLAQTRLGAFVGPVSALVAALAAIAILVLGSGEMDTGAREPGDLFAFLLYAALLTRPVGSFASTYGKFQIARGTLQRLREVIETEPEPGYRATRRLGRVKGAIALEGVSFAYPGRPPLLDKVDLAIAPGEIVALTGANGIGKSTLVKLILRFYEPDEGRITLDGEDIAEFQVQDVRRQYGYVPQRALLFDGTVLENIAFGLPDPDPAAVERAARHAQAWDFIQRLPQGFETLIGDEGVRLSGGQRQRIALARALLRDPPILIFDEATSMYDLDGEAAFVESCIQSLNGRTVIIITHRPASLALADRVIEASELGYVLHESPSRGASENAERGAAR
jgi:ATP-binding cassette subfamily B protein/subfamily B ATP-binding cassette protein MsbA